MSQDGNSTFLLIIEYDGAHFSGWQAQPGLRTVQAELAGALKKLFKAPSSITAAGRTDAGVHALSQAVSFSACTTIPAFNIQQALNANLGRDISIKQVRREPKSFNARHCAKIKIYEYRIWNRPYRSVWNGANAWHVKLPLDVGLMRKAARLLCGKRDFSSFEAKNSVLKSKIASLSSVRLSSRAGIITITFTGNRFLYKMVRNMVGTLVDVGLKKIEPEKIPSILSSKKRSWAGQTAPASGLFLKRIIF
jgi:tRNA pseudouridine38-40 synthase